MKTNMKNAMMAVLALSVSTAVGQTDSTSVQQRTTTTTTTETRVDNGAPAPATVQAVQAPPPAPAPAPAATQTDNRPPLRHGEFGLRYMPTFSSLRLRGSNGETINGEITMSHGWGLMGALNFSRHIGLQAEINYHEINQKYKDQGLNREVNVSYLNIPVMHSINTYKEAPVNLNFVVGPQFGFNVGAETSGDTSGNADAAQATVGAKAGDVGAAYGAGLEIMLNDNHTLRLDLGFRGYYGLVNMSADQTNNSGSTETYNVLLNASRKTYAGYLGLTFLF